MDKTDFLSTLILPILFFGAAIGSAVGCAVAAVRNTIALRKAAHWPSVRGTITASHATPGVKGGRGNLGSGHFRIRYKFQVPHEIASPTSRPPGHTHGFTQVTGSTPRLSGTWFWSFKPMQEFVHRYPVGQEVDVFYDPGNPKRNCLDREGQRGIRLLWFGAAVATLRTAALAWVAVAYP